METIRREVEFAWLAGIIDGEGNLNVQVRPGRNGKIYFRPKIRVANTDVRMIEKISRIYAELGAISFYSAHKQRGKNGAVYKTQLNIEIASQGSCRKLLERIIPYLANKKHLAEVLLQLIIFVQGMPKGGNTKAIDYVNDPVFVDLHMQFKTEARWYSDPSTIARRAGVPLVLPVIRSDLIGDYEKPAEMIGSALN